MPFDPEMDQVLKRWESEATGLVVSINRYGNGEPKVQIGPRMVLRKTTGTKSPTKAGRLTLEDLDWLYGIIDEVKEALSRLSTPGR